VEWYNVNTWPGLVEPETPSRQEFFLLNLQSAFRRRIPENIKMRERTVVQIVCGKELFLEKSKKLIVDILAMVYYSYIYRKNVCSYWRKL